MCQRIFRDLLQTFKRCLRNIRNTCKKPARKLQPFATVVRLVIFCLKVLLQRQHSHYLSQNNPMFLESVDFHIRPYHLIAIFSAIPSTTIQYYFLRCTLPPELCYIWGDNFFCIRPNVINILQFQPQFLRGFALQLSC